MILVFNPFLDSSESRLFCEISISIVWPFVLVVGAFVDSLAGVFQLAMESLFGLLDAQSRLLRSLYL